MCCFSRVPGGVLGRKSIEVTSTRIFARVAGGEQWLVYSMALATPADVAMVLPLPVGKVADDALEFIDLSGCSDLFTQLDDLFAPDEQMFALSRGAIQPRSKQLVVHQVGSFEASYVPRLADMTRLDPRFRIPDEVWAQRPEYADYGFAVFKLKQGAKQNIHPMAMRFPTAEPRTLFFPTVHVHDGELHDRAGFDHVFYFQLASGETAHARKPDGTIVTPLQATREVTAKVPVFATRGVLTPDGSVHRFGLTGEHPNFDVRVALD